MRSASLPVQFPAMPDDTQQVGPALRRPLQATVLALLIVLASVPADAQAPPAPVLVGPGGTSPSASERLTTTTPTLRWQAVTGVTNFGLWVSRYPYGLSDYVVSEQSIPGTATSYTVPAGRLEAGRQYRWYMQARNSAGWGSVSGFRYFHVFALVTVSLPARSAPPLARVDQPFTVSATLRVDTATAQSAGIAISFPELTEQGAGGTSYSSNQATVQTSPETTPGAIRPPMYNPRGTNVDDCSSGWCTLQHLQVDHEWDSVAAGTTRTLILTVTPKMAGILHVRIRAWATNDDYANIARDPTSGTIDQKFFYSFEHSVLVEGTPLAPPDLVVPSLNLSKYSGQPGDVVAVTSTIRNQGGQAAVSFNNQIVWSATSSLTNPMVLNSGFFYQLLVGETVDFNGPVTIPPASPGVYYIGVVADSGNSVNEGDREDNNKRSVQFTIQPSPPCLFRIYPEGRSLSHAGGSDTVTVTVTQGSNCSWTVTNPLTWVIVPPGAGGTGGGAVNYTVQPNPGPGGRFGSLTIAGIPFTVTQEAPPPCVFQIQPTSHTFPHTGGSASVTVTVTQGSNCSWTVSNPLPWLAASPANWTGNGTVNLTAQPNPGPDSRPGTLTIAGITLPVTQDAPPPPPCRFQLQPTSHSFPHTGGSHSVTVTVTQGSNCSWTVTNVPDWVTASPANWTGNGTVSLTAQPNTEPTVRSGTLTIAGVLFPVTQDPPPCAFQLQPTSHNFPHTGGSRTVAVTVTQGSNCTWTVANLPYWVTASPANWTGNGTVSLTAQPNTEPTARSATLTIAGIAFPVTQDPPPCAFQLQPTSQNFPHAGGSRAVTVRVIQGSNCSWTVSNLPYWLTASPANGTGNGTVSLTAQPNTEPTARSATLTIAGLSFPVTQDPPPQPCTFQLQPTSHNFPYTGASRTVAVTVTQGSNCTWTVANLPYWLTPSPPNGTGNGTVNLTALPNTEPTGRSGTLTIAGLSFPVTQDPSPLPCAFQLQPTSQNFPYTGASRTVTVTVTQGTNCSWTVANSPYWLTAGPANGTGTGTVNLTAQPNTEPTARSATLTIAGIAFPVTQDPPPQPCTFQLQPTSHNFPYTGASRTVTVTVTQGTNCSWTVANSPYWLTASPANWTGNGTVNLTAQPNTESAGRSGTLTIAGIPFPVTQDPPPQPDLRVSYAGPTPTTVLAFTRVSIRVDLTNIGTSQLQSVWLETEIRAADGRVIESTPAANMAGGLDFDNQGQPISPGGTVAYRATYAFRTSSRGESYVAGTYQYAFAAWRGGCPRCPGAARLTPIQTAPLTLTAPLPVPYYAQGGTYWCAWTSLSMLLTYHGTPRKPWEVAADWHKGPKDGVMAWHLFNPLTLDSPMRDYLARPELGYRADIQPWPDLWAFDAAKLMLFREYVRASVAAGRPVWLWILDEQHVVLIVGASQEGLLIHDPSGHTMAMAGYCTAEECQTINAFLSWDDFARAIQGILGWVSHLDMFSITLDKPATKPRTPVGVWFPTWAVDFPGGYESSFQFWSWVDRPPLAEPGLWQELATVWDGLQPGGYATVRHPLARGPDRADSRYGRVVYGGDIPWFWAYVSNASDRELTVSLSWELTEVDDSQTGIGMPRVLGTSRLRVKAGTMESDDLGSVGPITGLGLVDTDPVSIQYLRFTLRARAGSEETDTDSVSYIVAVNDPGGTAPEQATLVHPIAKGALRGSGSR